MIWFECVGYEKDVTLDLRVEENEMDFTNEGDDDSTSNIGSKDKPILG